MVCRNINEKKQLEIHNQHNSRQLEKANQNLTQTIKYLELTRDRLVVSEKMASLGGLVAGISHEINTPVGISLTAISKFAEMTSDLNVQFDDNLLTKSALKTYLDNSIVVCNLTVLNLKRSASLISSFKQIAVDQTSEEMRSFDVLDYFFEILNSLESVTKQANVTITLSCPKNLTINSYPGAFSQIITNLIMNSIYHGYPDRLTGLIKIHVEPDSKQLNICYLDDGVGIRAEHLPKIFDPFFTTNRNNGGSGLGLNIIYNIITSTFKGSIECTSVLSEGVCFKIRLPVDGLV
jgi:signal transduction histidine kinase